MPIKNRFAETHAEIAAWRQHLHQHPEIEFEVHETAKFVEVRTVATTTHTLVKLKLLEVV